MRPRNASPILNKKTKPNIPTAIANPFFLKKLIIGPIIVPVIYAVKLFIKLLDPSFSDIFLSVAFCFASLSVSIGS